MAEVLRALPSVLILLGAIALFLVLRGPLRRQRERDRVSPPSTRALAVRMLPFAAVLLAGGIWGLVTKHYPSVLYGGLGIVGFGIMLVFYARHQERQ